jgi:hypothetical protein
LSQLTCCAGAAATAPRFSPNGVVMIVWKKVETEKVLVTISSSLTLGTADSSTLPRYQNKYGAGYGPYYASGWFNLDDINGDGVDDLTTPLLKMLHMVLHLTRLLVYQWNLFTHNWLILTKSNSLVAGKTIQIQYGVQVVQLTLFLDGGTETSSLD